MISSDAESLSLSMNSAENRLELFEADVLASSLKMISPEDGQKPDTYDVMESDTFGDGVDCEGELGFHSTLKALMRISISASPSEDVGESPFTSSPLAS